MKFPRKKWSRREVIIFLEKLELYVSSGMAIDKALRICTEGGNRKRLAAITNVLKTVESGGYLSHALEKHVGLSGTAAGLIEHGEIAGSLAASINSAKTMMEKEDELLKKCRGAMIYPVVIGIFAAALTIGLVRGVMPQIIPMLKSLHVSLPLLTRVVIFVSEGILKFGLYGAGIFAVLSVAFILALKKSPKFRSVIHSILFRIPILGTLLHQYSLSVFLRSCGSLIDSGLSSSDSYGRSVRTISFLPLKKALHMNIEKVKRGVGFGEVTRNYRRMPEYIPALLSAGESSGTLGKSVLKCASILEQDIDHSLKKLTSLIEPVMMAGMGMVVGSIALSIMLPIYDISKVLQKG
jgi:type II secretory pathway component PulF